MHEIMTIEEVATYLRVSERTVYDWAQKGDLPGGKLGTTWRFKRSDIEGWVSDRIAAGGQQKSSGISKGSSTLPLTAERVLILDSASKKEVLNQLGDLLAASPYVKKREELIKGIFEREELMSTGIGFGVGVPHVRMSAVTDVVMAVAVSKTPIADYTSLDEQPVQIVCMLAARKDQHKEYIRTLSSVSSRLKDSVVREKIIQANDPSIIYEQLIGGE